LLIFPLQEFFDFLTLNSCHFQTIWKYDALYHLITEHSNDDMVPEIPGELLVDFSMHKKE
jgi:hypothetical protein